MDDWQSDIEDPPLGDPQSGAEDNNIGHHSDDFLEKMEGHELDISLIQKWMIWWMEAYRDGSDGKEAQLLVKRFSSCRYISHHVSTEAMGQRMD